MQRGEIWWASMSTPRGSEPGYRRPVLVIQSNAFTASRIQTVLVAVLTSNLELAAAPGNLIVKRKQSGLTRDSVVNVPHVVTLNKSFLTEKVGALPPKLMNAVDERQNPHQRWGILRHGGNNLFAGCSFIISEGRSP